jgi:hypothetical protein
MIKPLVVVVLGLVVLLLILGSLGLMVGTSSFLAMLACATVLFFVLYRRTRRTRAAGTESLPPAP